MDNKVNLLDMVIEEILSENPNMAREEAEQLAKKFCGIVQMVTDNVEFIQSPARKE